MAALGMSMSSLLVAVNAMRLPRSSPLPESWLNSGQKVNMEFTDVISY
jgi:hypothetical protein